MTNTAMREAIAATNPDLTDEVLDAIVAAAELKMAEAHTEEVEAAELEGVAPMPADLIPLREEKLLLDKQKELLESRLKEIKDTFGERLKDEGLVGYQLHGKVHARRSPGSRTDVDRKRLKDEMPHIYKEFLKTTPYWSIRIN